MGESPADGDHRRSAARQACRRVGVGGSTCTPERRDLWRDLLSLVIAVGPIDEAVRRGIGRASHPRAPFGTWPRSLGLISETSAIQPDAARRVLNPRIMGNSSVDRRKQEATILLVTCTNSIQLS